MKLLIDTHVLLWALGSPDRISDPTRRRIEDPNNVDHLRAYACKTLPS